MSRIVGRALLIEYHVVVWLLTWTAHWLGLRRVWFKLVRRGRPYEPLRNEVLAREFFEAMGPTFIKLGQVVASSPGLFPKRYSEEFAKCLDRVPPFALSVLEDTVTRELGLRSSELFRSLEPEPLGSASVAQVHGAVLPDGRDVVVKVQRPGIARVVDADLWWMRRGARTLEFFFEGARLANLSGVIADFDRTIHEELDFRAEAENLREFNRMMAEHGIEDVRAPVPVDEMVSRSVLVMERFRGFKADDVEQIIGAGIKPECFLRKGLRAWLLTVMLYGFFHGDAHAGNLMMLPDGPAVGFLDFGIIGRFTDKQRHQVMRYVLAFAASDYEALADIMIEIGAVRDDIDRVGLVADLERVYAPLLGLSMSEIRYDEILPDATRIAYRYGITLPREFLLILKQMLFFDRYAKISAPNLNVFSDYHLVDFLFTPGAMRAGLDFNLLAPLLQRIQEINREREAAAASLVAS